MKKNVLKIIVENINFFEDNKFEIDFTNQLQVTNHDSTHPYYHLESRIYLAKYLAFVGVNASGKTTIIEILSAVFDFYFYNRPFNERILSKFFRGSPLKTTFIYEYNAKVFKIISIITNHNEADVILFEDDNDYYINNYSIVEEVIYEKRLNKSTVKSSLLVGGFVEIFRRSKLDEKTKVFLGENESMINILNHKTKQTVVSVIENGISLKKIPLPPLGIKIDLEIVKYLDPSIKEIKEIKLSNLKERKITNNISYLIEFEGGKEIEVSLRQLNNVLSMGTLKGMRTFFEVKEVLRSGGYYLIDEIEAHLNRTIILDIIKLFEDHETNPNNATLIFTTHYTEILDAFIRNDQIIYIHRNGKYEIKTTNYSSLSKRNELKRSDVYFADTFNLGTAISYKNFLNMKKLFILTSKDKNE